MAARLLAVVLTTNALRSQTHHVARLVRLQGGGEVPSLQEGIAQSLQLLDGGDVDGAEALLLDLRCRDPRRGDLPPPLLRAFARVFEARRDAAPEDAGPCDALAALRADAEDWDGVFDACVEGIRRGGATDRRRALKLRASRSTWRGFDGDADETAEAEALVAADAVAAFAALALNVSGEACARRSRAALDAAVEAARAEVAALGDAKPAAAASRPGGRNREIPGRAGAPRVAFLTPDANGAHPLSQLLPSALVALDDADFEKIVLVTMCAADGSVERERAELSADVVVEGHAASPLAIAAAIRDLDVDVLVDMCGHAGSSDVAQVLAHRPARVQIQGALGTPAPMGGAGIFDWCLCDRVVAPEHLKTAAGWGAGDHGALRLPRTYFVGDAEAYKRHELDGVRTARSDHGLRDGAVVLACMNRPHKVDRDGFDGWVRVVRDLAHPADGAEPVDAVLWLYAPVTGDDVESLRDRALRRAAALLPGGLAEATERVAFAGPASRPQHLERLRHADLALDTRHYNSHTLACDYAWAGVPLVTALCDDEPRWASRVGASATLAATRYPEIAQPLVATDWGAAYAAVAIALARGGDRRRALSVALRRGRVDAPLWSGRRWADGFRRALAAALGDGAGGDIDVPPLVDSAHCIVLASAARRVENFERLAAAAPEIKRFKAVEGGAPDAVGQAIKDLGITLATDVWQATVGQVACLCSHASLWRRFSACPKPHFVVLEDDARFPAGADAFRRAVDDVVRGEPFDVCYLYVYPDHWPSPPRVADDPNRFRVSTTPGFRTWCLLAYVVSKRGAEKLRRLIETEEVYAPIDCMVADWGSRGLLDVRCVDAKGFVDNAGQLDMRVPDDADALPSNIWGTADFGGVAKPVHSHAMPPVPKVARPDEIPTDR